MTFCVVVKGTEASLKAPQWPNCHYMSNKNEIATSLLRQIESQKTMSILLYSKRHRICFSLQINKCYI